MIRSELSIAGASIYISKNKHSEAAKKHSLIRIIHVVVDRIHTTTRARILTSWASIGQSRLRRSVSNAVTGAGASTLEDVVEPHPVTDLVSGGSTEVVVCEGATWGSGVEDVASIRAFKQAIVSKYSILLL